MCDGFCSRLKITKQEPDKIWDFLQPYFHSTQPYAIRFAVVMVIFYYLNEEYLDEVFQLLDKIRHEDYYVKMAVAWVLSTFYINFSEPTLNYLRRCNLDNFTYNKTLQKIAESSKVSLSQKVYVKTIRR
ncbi:Uncharacterised protein [Suttonella ornithocola]|uniref:DNA alkylation repair enzyme n=1 Tax=Suttonella ornithocola TaxID=279832 RepID=A0A380MRF4_9GAMM|nr:Uncharacterised protein [Suttonella ornithocola]